MKGYKLSKDYEFLWKLIHEDYIIAAWLDYDKDYQIKDIVEVKMLFEYQLCIIGTRGIAYGGNPNTIKDFTKICEAYNLEFIVPNIDPDELELNVESDIKIPLIHEVPKKFKELTETELNYAQPFIG